MVVASASGLAFESLLIGCLQHLRYALLQRGRIEVHLEPVHLVEPSVDGQLCREEEHSKCRYRDVLPLRIVLYAVCDACPQVDLVADDV